jgi:hypothetical protein
VEAPTLSQLATFVVVCVVWLGALYFVRHF